MNTPWGERSEMLALRCDGEPIAAETLPRNLCPPKHDEFWQWLPSPPPGRHVIECDVFVHLHNADGRYDKVGDVRPVFDFTKTLEAEFEVLEALPTDYIKLVSSPQLDLQVRRCITPVGFHVWHGTDEETGVQRTALQGGFRVSGRLPVNVAFRVLAGFEGTRVIMGPLTINAGEYEPFRTFMIGKDIDATWRPERLNLVLPSSESVAMDTLDLYEIWDGEIEFRSVPVGSATNPKEYFGRGD